MGTVILPRRLAGLAMVALLVGLAGPLPARAVSPLATFDTPSGTFVFGTSITFSDSVLLTASPKQRCRPACRT